MKSGLQPATAVIKNFEKNIRSLDRPSKEEAKKAVEVLIKWAGDNPEREGLKDTPERVVNAYKEFFSGYNEDPEKLLRTFEKVSDYDEMVVLTDIDFISHCEHHLVPIVGKAHIAYIPGSRIVGISKLGRLVDIFAKRLQLQEAMTTEIANALNKVIKPKGVAVMIEASHQCITTRGVKKPSVSMVTSKMLGEFKTNNQKKQEFLDIINKSKRGN